MATVYLARDLRHDRLVAVKVFAPESGIARGAERFLDEIRIAARLTHPNILPLHDSGEVDGLLYYVMPYVPGESLRARLDREGPLPVEDAVQIAREVADALAYAHSLDVVHRDIKPENVLLLSGHAVVADFGIASAISRALDRQSPTTNRDTVPNTQPAFGTPTYMSPEQATGGSRLDGRSDVYSLGCVLYEMLAGDPPFRGPSGPALTAAHLSDPVPSLRSWRGSVSPALEQAVHTALAKAPADRFLTAGRFAEALGAVDAPPRRSGEGVARPRRWAWAAGVVAVLLSRFNGASKLDPALYLVMPFSHRAGAAPLLLNGDQCESLLYSSLSQWGDLRLVDPLWVSDARQRQGGGSRLSDGLALARARGAGRLLTGEVWTFRDSTVRVRAALYDVSGSGTELRESEVRIAPDLHDAETRFAELADSLVLDQTRAPSAAGGAMGTRSLAAWQRYQDGHMALGAWDLLAAAQAFRSAAALDPEYALARLWLAQARNWNGDAADEWRSDLAGALATGTRLSPPDRRWGNALLALGEGRFVQACDEYRRLIGADSLSFRGWYGLGECQARDRTVVRDPKSPSGWRFRSSYRSAIQAYNQALTRTPSVHLAFQGAAFERLTRLLYTESNTLRGGFALEPDTLYFGAFPSLNADTLAFVPYPIAQALAQGPEAFPPSTPVAVARNRESLLQVTTAWRRAFPKSIGAIEAQVRALETVGRLQDGPGGEPSALALVETARSLATSQPDRLRLSIAQVRLLLKLEQWSEARSLADSVLRLWPTVEPDEAQALASLAALTGRAALAARILRREVPVFQLTDADGRVTPVPPAVAEAGLTLLAFASTGGPLDSLNAAQTRVDRVVQSYVAKDHAAAVRRLLLNRPAYLTFFEQGARPRGELSPEARGPEGLQARFAKGDSAGVRRELAALATLRSRTLPGDVALDAVFQESRLFLALHDTATAAQHLDQVLNALPTVGTSLLDQLPQAGALPRALILRSQLAARGNDVVTARRWAEAALTLWSSADAGFRPALDSLKAIAGAPGPH